MLVTLDSNLRKPLYLQIRDQIRDRILNGGLKPGDRLEPSRELAHHLGVHRTTVGNAYADLESEGLIQGTVGRGTFVTPLGKTLRAPRGGANRPSHDLFWEGFLPEEPRDDSLGRLMASSVEEGVISFAAAHGADELTSPDLVRRAADAVLRREGGRLVQYGSTGGFQPLKSYLQTRLRRDGIPVELDEILVTHGCQQSLDLLRRALISPGETVVCENPTYTGLWNVFDSPGVRLIGVPVTPEGMDLDALESLLEQTRVKLIFCSPTFQNPTGFTMPLAARQRLLELALRFQVPIVEDDVYGALRYHGRQIPPLKALDATGLVIYLNSFSKVGFPGLRVGWLVASRPVIERLRWAKQRADLHTNMLGQAVVQELGARGWLDKWIRKTCKIYAQKQAVLRRAIDRNFPPDVNVIYPDGGMSLWVELPAFLDAAELLVKARERQVIFAPARYFYFQNPRHNALRLCYTALPDDKIEKGAAILGELLKAEMRRAKKGKACFLRQCKCGPGVICAQGFLPWPIASGFPCSSTERGKWRFGESTNDMEPHQIAEPRNAPLEMSPEEFRALGYRLVDQIAEFVGSLPGRRVSPGESPGEIRALLGDSSLPDRGTPAGPLLDEAVRLLLEHSLFNGHPRFMGFITSPAAPLVALGELLAASVNPNVGGWILSPMASEIEAQTIRWIAEMIGYPREAGGILVTGGTMANFVAFLAARKAKLTWDARAHGLAGECHRRLRVYASTEVHTWIHKAVDLFGLGLDSIAWISVNSNQQINTAELRERIDADKAQGALPFMVIGTAGTVSTGAVDPLPEIASIAREQGLWFHVDGAYGGFAVVAPNAPADLRGIGEADSVAVDPHKWLYAPLEAGCTLLRDRNTLHDAFTQHRPSYYKLLQDEEEAVNYFEYGPENSRGFRALKIWLALRQVGREGYAQMIGDDIRLAKTLFELAEAHLELQAFRQGLSITTFRYVPRDLHPGDEEAETYLNRLNSELLERLQKSGEAFLTNAVIGGAFVLRACIVNFRTSLADIRALPDIIARLGGEVDRELRPEAARETEAEAKRSSI